MKLLATLPQIRQALGERLPLGNPLALPVVTSATVNVGLGELQHNEALRRAVIDGLSLLTGQRPVESKAKKAIASFKIRRGDIIGYRVTLRKRRLVDFLNRLITYVLPRLRDFRGFSLKGFDGRGNYTLGLREYTVFPEIPYGEISWGLEITLTTSAVDDQTAQILLETLGFPFAKQKG